MQNKDLLKNVKVVFFDFDGVLADTSLDIADAVNAMLIKYNRHPLSPEEILRYVGNGAKVLIQKVLSVSTIKDETDSTTNTSNEVSSNHYSTENFEEIYQGYLQYYYNNCVNKTKLYSGILVFLELLNIYKIQMGIISNKPLAITNEILEKMNIKQFFDIVVGPELVSKPKPSSQGIIYALEKINNIRKEKEQEIILPEQVLMIGDSEQDIIAGSNANVLTCAVTAGYGDKTKLLAAKPDFEVHLASELLVTFQSFL